MTINRNEVTWAELGFLPVSVGYAPNKKAWKKALKDIGIPPEPFPVSDGRCAWWSNVGELRQDIILIAVGKRAKRHSMAQVAGIIAHECMHAWRYIRENIGEKEPSAEFEAYVLQALVQSVVHAHQSKRRKPWSKK